MSRPIVQPFFETMNHGVRTRRSQHQVTYELPGRPFLPILGLLMILLNLLYAAVARHLGTPFFSWTSIYFALQFMFFELLSRTRKTRIVLSSGRLTVESRTLGIRTSWRCDVGEIRSLSRDSTFNTLFVLVGKKRAIAPLGQRRATVEYLQSEIADWIAANSPSSQRPKTCTQR